MTHICELAGGREETLVAYIYDEIDPAARTAFEAHLANCAVCRDELRELRSVRGRLARWSPPEPKVFTPPIADRRSAMGPRRWWNAVPAWAQVAAAMLFLGAAAAIANLEVRYDQAGLTIRTGWSRSSPSQTTTSSASNATAALRAELAALDQQLRAELRDTRAIAERSAATASAAAPRGASAASDADVMRRVRMLVDETEKRQQRELALRVGEVLRDVNAQRQADLVRIDRSLGAVQNNLGVEVLKQRQSLAYLMRVNQRQ